MTLARGGGRVRSAQALLTTPERPLRYIAVAWLFTFVPAALLSALVSMVLPEIEQPDFPAGNLTIFILIVLFAPVTETLIMGSILLLLRRLVPEPWAVAISAAGWGIVHSLQAFAWGLVIWWPFLVFSAVFMVWCRRSVAGAFAVVSALHALHNLLPALTLLYRDQLS